MNPATACWNITWHWSHCRRAIALAALPYSTSTQRVERRKATTNQSSLLPGQFLLGPPHAISNIRPVKFYIPPDETPAEKRYREMREEAVQRDHEFWLDNNTRFEQGKLLFEQQLAEQKGQCTLDDLSVYYHQYQVDSYTRHLEYNRYVWRRSLRMIWPGIRAWLVEIGKRKKRRVDALAKYSEQGYFDREQPGVSRVEHVQNSTGQTAKNQVDRRAEKIRSYY
ncbi:hypothetical protein H4R20_001520 [Coemansia guatemalensis]|uniref:Apoptogenic protein 1, mitochondrial n=1 Tax=Coemansia guatemalensis TaxID=2761395 RepID=A0A9W8HZF4_9FUNG|nr:hypothetical protein H4R20_001520 [Coemansia guatemalensis]